MKLKVSKILFFLFLIFALGFSISSKTQAAGGGTWRPGAFIVVTDPPGCICPVYSVSCWCVSI